MKYTFKPKGVCSFSLEFDLEGDIVRNIEFQGGCNGNLKGIASLADGMTVTEIQDKLRGIRCGYLDPKFEVPALKAFEACVNAIEENESGVFFSEISGPTIPLPVFPKLGYKAVPLGKNWSYGVAALLFAAIEYKKYFTK